MPVTGARLQRHPRRALQDPDRIVDGMEERPGMVLAAIVMRPEDRRRCGPVWLEHLATWLLERAGFEVSR